MPISQINTNSIANGSVVAADLAAGAALSNLGSSQLADANMAPGSVIQVVTGSTTTSTLTTSGTFIATAITVTITPSSSTSKILILHNGMINILASSRWCWYTLARNGTNLIVSGAANAFGGVYNANSTDTHAPTCVAYLDSPATTSATTYAIYVKTEAGATGRYNADGWFTTINALEIAG